MPFDLNENTLISVDISTSCVYIEKPWKPSDKTVALRESWTQETLPTGITHDDATQMDYKSGSHAAI